ncbi:MAG: SCO family protein [Candidatus Acidiferrales bacterium]|jgi:protein SCO1
MTPATPNSDTPRVLTLFATFVFILGAFVTNAADAQHYQARGIVLNVDPTKNSLYVSTDAIPGFMEAMAMSYPVKNPKDLEGLAPGAMIDFTLTVTADTSYIENIKVRAFESLEQDPLTARRLKLLDQLDSAGSATKLLEPGQHIPDFTLTDQSNQPVTLSTFSRKVVVLSFMYTRCALPNYCFRLSNNLSRLQKRFHDQLGRDIILLSITFDPAHDQPPQLADYAKIWKADPAAWHMLTGSTADVQNVCREFGVVAYPDEGLLIHSLHTVIIDRQGNLAANLEGNEFTATQLGDLVETVMKR